jgi:cytochrome c oxidase accessory protein FixG
MSEPQRIAVDAVPSEVGELDLYQKRERIYTRKVEGFFQRLRLYTGWPLLLGYFCVPWLDWGSRQAVWFDLPGRQFHILALTFWPQDFPLLACLLIIAAFALFTVTVFAGRVWCGYTCPQTVWTSIFMWAEQVTEGTRNQRIRLDQSPWTSRKFLRKSAKHALWLGIAAFTGVTFVGYFSPIRELVVALPTLRTSAGEASWSLFFTLATYINAGWLREQVCMYMCPYARFQSVMFDHDTLVVSYDRKRGEPRGSRKHGQTPPSLGLGDCVDCQLCVQVCPTGIDIRDGLQYQCIGCALCVDACDSVMDRMGYARGLVRYTTENALLGKASRLLRPRLVGYSVAVLLMLGLFTTVLLSRVTVGIEAIRERGQLYREVSDDSIENVYTLKLRNMAEVPRRVRLTVEGMPGMVLAGDTELTLAPAEVLALPVSVRAPEDSASGSQEIVFGIAALDGSGERSSAKSRFLAPTED